VAVDRDRSGALLIRVWVEGADGAFRGRLTTVDTTPDAVTGAAPEAAGEGTTVAVTSSPGDLLDAVRTWLDGFRGDAAPAG
jgi:hypothetical protein